MMNSVRAAARASQRRSLSSAARVEVGAKIPSGVQVQLARSWFDGVADGFKGTPSGELFAGKKVVVVGLPGAFTGMCTTQHIPGYMAAREEFKAAGVDAVYCLSVNDAYTMHGWEEAMGSKDAITMVADVDADLVKELGLGINLAVAGLGDYTRATRFALVANDGVVEQLFVEEAPSTLEVSAAENVLKALK